MTKGFGKKRERERQGVKAERGECGERVKVRVRERERGRKPAATSYPTTSEANS